MALRPLVTAAKRGQVLALPAGKTELTAQYTLGDAEMSLVRQPRGDANKLGFAIQLCLLRYPGIALADDTRHHAAKRRFSNEATNPATRRFSMSQRGA